MPKQAVEQNIIVALGAEPRTLDPLKAVSAGGMRIMDLLFQSLVRLSSDLSVVPSLAKSYSYKNKVYTFVVDRDVKFSNGRKLAKEDLLFSFDEYRSDKSPFSSSFGIIKSVDVRETQTEFILAVELKKESAKFLSADLPVLKILPKREFLQAGADFQKAPIGTGPFKLKSRDSGQIVLTARRDVLQPPKIDQVTFKIIRDDFTRFQKMLNEELDVAQSEISFSKVDRFKKGPFRVFRQPGLSMTYLLLNFKDKCLRQKNLRRAMVLSLDRLKIIQHKLNGFARPAVTILGAHSFFFNKAISHPPYNPLRAGEIFRQLSEECRQKVFSLKTSSARSAVDHGKVLALQLRKTGFKIRTESFEWGAFYGDLNAGRFQTALLKWVGAVDPDIYRLAFHSREHPPKGRNRGFYAHPTLDRLLDRGVTEMNKAKRRLIYNQVQEIIQKNLVFIPLWHEEQVSVVRNNILNYSLSDNGDFQYLLRVTKAGAK